MYADPQATYPVVSPEPARARRWITPTPPLSELAGKTVAELWDYRFRGDRIFELVERELSARAPGIRFVPYPVFGDVHGAREREVLRDLPRLLSLHGCQAVISALGA